MQLGVRTCLDFAKADRKRIRQLLTVVGEILWWEINGTPVQPYYTERPPHMALARGGSIGQATPDPNRVLAWPVGNLERLIEELKSHVLLPGQMAVWVS
jgi:DNA polymerase V